MQRCKTQFPRRQAPNQARDTEHQVMHAGSPSAFSPESTERAARCCCAPRRVPASAIPRPSSGPAARSGQTAVAAGGPFRPAARRGGATPERARPARAWPAGEAATASASTMTAVLMSIRRVRPCPGSRSGAQPPAPTPLAHPPAGQGHAAPPSGRSASARRTTLHARHEQPSETAHRRSDRAVGRSASIAVEYGALHIVWTPLEGAGATSRPACAAWIWPAGRSAEAHTWRVAVPSGGVTGIPARGDRQAGPGPGPPG